MKSLNLTPERYNEFAVENFDFFRNLNFRDYLIENPLPGIDLDTLNAFFWQRLMMRDMRLTH